MSLDQTITKVLNEIPECIAVAVVDISTGMLISAETKADHAQKILDMLAAATGDLYKGNNVVAIEEMFKKMRGSNQSGGFFKEIIITSDNMLHVFQRGKHNTNLVLVIVTRVDVNFGMVLTKARQALPSIEGSF